MNRPVLISTATPRATRWQRFRFIEGGPVVVTESGKGRRRKVRILHVTYRHPEPGNMVERLVPSDDPMRDLRTIAHFYCKGHVPAWYAEFSAGMGVPLREASV